MVSENVVVVEGAEQLHDYELVLVINSAAAEEKLEATIESVSRLITGKGGSPPNIARWGRKRLAYPIKHAIEGSYVLFRFQMKPDFTKELVANLRISEDVLRHLLVRLES